jgi:hypothetical protein
MRRVMLSSFLCLLLSEPFAAQRIQANKKPEGVETRTRSGAASVTESEKPAAAKQRALALLDELLRRTDSFEDPVVRIRAKADIANVLWKFDEPRARSIISESFAAAAGLRSTNPDAPSLQPDPSLSLRSELTNLAASRDSKLAQTLVASVVDQPTRPDEKTRAATAEIEKDRLLGQLLATLAWREPDRAAMVASELIQKGNLQEPLQMLLRFGDQTRVHDLVVQALEVCKRDPGVAKRNIRWLADYFFPSFGEGVIRFSQNAPSPPDTKPRELQMVPEFLDLAHRVLMDQLGSQASPQPNAPSDVLIARLLLPYFEEYLPDRAPSLRQRVEERLKAASSSGYDPLSSSVVYESLTVREMMDRAATINDVKKRDWAYMFAFSRAEKSGQYEEAAQIVSRLSNAAQRASLQSLLETRVQQEQRLKAMRAMSRGDFDESIKLVRGLTDLRTRAVALVSLANMQGKDQKVRAAGLIEDARSAAAGLETAVERAWVLVSITSAALRIDPTTNVEATISAVNAAGFARQWEQVQVVEGGAKKNVGLVMISRGLASMFTLLDKQDFEKSIALAHEIGIQELSVFAQIGACRAVLDSN